MPRVYEVARELGVSSKEVLADLERLGHGVKSHSSVIDAEAAELVRRERSAVSDGGPAPAAAAEPSADQEATAVVPTTGASPDAPAKRKKSLVAHLAEIPMLVLFAFAIAIVIKTFLVQAFYIPSGSMLPTLQIGDRVLVEKITYRFGGPERGDVVVFAKEVFGSPPDLPWHEDAQNFVRELLGLPVGQEEDYIKRVVAVGGDRIRYAGSPRRLTVNGERVDQPFIAGGVDEASPSVLPADCSRLGMQRDRKACVVPAGKVFVMGDNRSDSEDSRILGPVDESKIVGHAVLIIWPPSDAGTL